MFATQPMAYWADALDPAGMWWAPVQTVSEMIEDPPARASGAFVPTHGAEGVVDMVASPADFSATSPEPASMAPEFGQHTEESLP